MNRRQLLQLSLAALAPKTKAAATFDPVAIERPRVIRLADSFLSQPPVTVTATLSARSAGGPHDYFSEGDYWWPDPKDPDAPYIQRDGMSNPANFDDHRKALLRLSVQAPALCAAWKVSGQRKYADAAARHLRAWFLNEPTRMNPNLEYAQAIHGRATGRGTGIIDTIHLVEVVRGAFVIEPSGALTRTEIEGLKTWFATYVEWLTTHAYGLAERDAKNNHGTCWVMQTAEFARYTQNAKVTELCRDRFRTGLLTQMAEDGSFPLELARTKPYGYSIFNLDAMATACEILTGPQNDLWSHTLPDGRNMGKAVAYLFPYLADKSKWPKPADVMYFDQWPVRQAALFFAGRALARPEYLALWQKLPPDPQVEETIRNYPIRQPVLWARQ